MEEVLKAFRPEKKGDASVISRDCLAGKVSSRGLKRLKGSKNLRNVRVVMEKVSVENSAPH
jgi:hypothetical protein